MKFYVKHKCLIYDEPYNRLHCSNFHKMKLFSTIVEGIQQLNIKKGSILSMVPLSTSEYMFNFLKLFKQHCNIFYKI